MKSKFILKEVETSETAKDYMGEQISVGDIVVLARSYGRSTPSLEHGVVNKITICRDPDSLEITDTRLEIKRIGSSISYRDEGDIVNFSYGRRKKSYILNILKI
jgi:hypothetical protein